MWRASTWCFFASLLCSVRSDWLECQVKSGSGGGGGERGAVGITFANIATNSRFTIGCICGSVARSHVKSTPPPPASRVCAASATKTRPNLAPRALPVTGYTYNSTTEIGFKICSRHRRRCSGFAGRGVLHSTISLSATALCSSQRRPLSLFSAIGSKRLVCFSAFSLSPCIPMSSTFWSDACTYAINKPLPTRLEALYASCGATVRRPTPSLVSLWHAYSFVAGRLISV